MNTSGALMITGHWGCGKTYLINQILDDVFEKDKKEIDSRLCVVDFFVQNADSRAQVREYIGNVGDLERITARAAAGKIMPREMVQLKRGLYQMAPIREICQGATCQELQKLASQIDLFDELKVRIERTMLAEPAAQFGKGDIIADGVNEELDNLRQIARHGKDYLLQVQQREIERTGIPSLKIRLKSQFRIILAKKRMNIWELIRRILYSIIWIFCYGVMTKKISKILHLSLETL